MTVFPLLPNDDLIAAIQDAIPDGTPLIEAVNALMLTITRAYGVVEREEQDREALAEWAEFIWSYSDFVKRRFGPESVFVNRPA